LVWASSHLLTFWSVVIFSPLFEESVKRLGGSNRYKAIASGLIGLMDVPLNPHEPTWVYLTRVYIHGCIHYSLSQLPFKNAVLAHATYNAAVLYLQPVLIAGLSDWFFPASIFNRVLNWIQQYPWLTFSLGAAILWCINPLPLAGGAKKRQAQADLPLLQSYITDRQKRTRSGLVDALSDLRIDTANVPATPLSLNSWAIAAERFVKEQSFVPAVDCADLNRPAQHPDIKVKDNLVVYDDPTPAVLGYYQWYSTPVPLFRPRLSSVNLKAMVYNRLTRDTPTADSELWRIATILFCQTINTGFVPFFNTKPRCTWPKTTRLTVNPSYQPDAFVGDWTSYEALIRLELSELELYPRGYTIEDISDLVNLGDFTVDLQSYAAPKAVRELAGSNPVFGPQIEFCYPEANEPFDELTTFEQKFEQWLLHTDPAKRKRYISAFKAVKEQPLTPEDREVRLIQVNVKHDEVLIKFPETTIDEYPNLRKKSFIPRPIHAVDPKLTVQIGPELYPVVESFKKHFQFAPLASVNGFIITGTMGAGMTSNQLSIWYETARYSPGWHILVAGDDSLVCYNATYATACSRHNKVLPRHYFFEGDLTQCDHTNGPDALLNEYTILHQFGLPIETIELLYASAAAKLLIGFRNNPGQTIEVYRSPERNTGGTDTTIGNTCTVMTAFLLAIVKAYDTITGLPTNCCCDPLFSFDDDEGQHFTTHMSLAFVDVFEKLGLQLKMRSGVTNRDGIADGYDSLPTFLKGTWYPCKPVEISDPYVDMLASRLYVNVQNTLTHVWGPLPSRLLKLGKTFRDPRELFGVDSLDVALTMYSQAMAESVYGYVWPTPIKTWLRTLFIPSVPVTEDVKIREQMRKDLEGDLYGLFTIEASTFEVELHDTSCLMRLAQHYAIEPEQLADFFDKLQHVGPFTHLEYPVWWALTRDYA